VRAADNSIARDAASLRSGQTVETFADMRIEPGAPDDLFETVNRQSTHVIAVDPGFVEIRPAPGTYSFSDTVSQITVPEAQPGTRNLLLLRPADGVDPIGLSVRIAASGQTLTVTVAQRGPQEEFTGLVMDPDSPRYLSHVLANESRFIRSVPLSSRDTNRLPTDTAAPIEFTGGRRRRSPSTRQPSIGWPTTRASISCWPR
jgi:hypothetical protein